MTVNRSFNTYKNNLEKLKEYSEYLQGWDGTEDSKIFSEWTIENSKLFLSVIDNTNLKVSAKANDTVQFKWDFPDMNRYLKIKISGPNVKISSKVNGEKHKYEIKYRTDELIDIVNDFILKWSKDRLFAKALACAMNQTNDKDEIDPNLLRLLIGLI